MENLPREVLSNIFIRLLAKQLAQMRCVCKSWNALLSESSFIKSHLHHSIHQNDEILLFFSRVFSFYHSPFIHPSPLTPHPFPFTAHPSRSPNLKLKPSNFFKLPDKPKSEYSHGNVIGSINGLICFNYGPFSLPSRDYAICVWNPSLSALLTLPPCPLPSGDSKTKTNFRFGYDPNTDDYKVVKLTSLVPQVAVYSMRKGSWDLITQRFPLNMRIIKCKPEVCVDGYNGRLHWLCYTKFKRKLERIVAFDLGEETFSVISLPDSILQHDQNRWNVFGVLAGKLCVMSRVRDGDCEVWVMDDYGVAESWVKLHAFSQFDGAIYPYGFTLHNEFLFQVDIDCFALYDPIVAKPKNFENPCPLNVVDKVVHYVESLVWVVPAESEGRCYNISQFPF
ncbi:hypothetical protein Lser_V15G05167 [Lactuca serriola]